MWVLGWLVYPSLSEGLSTTDAGLMRLRLLTLGLIWQFILSMIILYREEGNIRLETIRRRFWLNNADLTQNRREEQQTLVVDHPTDSAYCCCGPMGLGGPLIDLWVSDLSLIRGATRSRSRCAI